MSRTLAPTGPRLEHSPQLGTHTLSVPRVVVIGSNHEYAPVDVRERLAFSGDALRVGLESLGDHVREGMILSTCNRTEIYAVGDDSDDIESRIFAFLMRYHHVPDQLLRHSSYVHQGPAAVSHIFRVASGLDSMVLGEPQILSQIRDALDHARDAGSVGPILQRLATDALRTGKRARTETDIARNRVSIAHAAVELANDETGGLGGKSVLVLGAGKMATLTAKLARGHGLYRLVVINRSLPRAQEVAALVDGLAMPMTALDAAIADADVVFGAAMVDDPIVTVSRIRERRMPLHLIDLGVPRVVESECGLLPMVHVRDVDALEPVARATRLQYEAEVGKVETLVETAVSAFAGWTQSRKGAEAIGRVRGRAQRVQDEELERTLRRLTHLSARDLNIVRSLAHGLTNKLVHDPVMALRRATTEDEIAHILDTMGVGPTD